jgi:hypothetical protein
MYIPHKRARHVHTVEAGCTVWTVKGVDMAQRVEGAEGVDMLGQGRKQGRGARAVPGRAHIGSASKTRCTQAVNRGVGHKVEVAKQHQLAGGGCRPGHKEWQHGR